MPLKLTFKKLIPCALAATTALAAQSYLQKGDHATDTNTTGVVQKKDVIDTIYQEMNQIQGAFVSAHPYISQEGVLRVGFGVPLEEADIDRIHFYRETSDAGRVPYPKEDNWTLVEQLTRSGQSVNIIMSPEEIEDITKNWLRRTYRVAEKVLPEIKEMAPSKQAALMMLEITQQALTRDIGFLGKLRKALKTDSYLEVVSLLRRIERTHLVQGKRTPLFRVDKEGDAFNSDLIMRLTRPEKPRFASMQQIMTKHQRSAR